MDPPAASFVISSSWRRSGGCDRSCQPPEPSASSREGTDDHWGHLRLLERIGRGTFGEVFRAWDTRLDREVALKLMPAGHLRQIREVARSSSEGRLLARVRHPNVVTIYGAEQIGDRIGLWMEFVRGRTLEQLLTGRHAFTRGESPDRHRAVRAPCPRCTRAGLLHRDIKAQNVMRADDGRMVLMDFGAGRELDDECDVGSGRDAAVSGAGDFRWRIGDVRSDIYSLGVLLLSTC